MRAMLNADDEFTLMICGQHELVVVANWKTPCWKWTPMYQDAWSSTVWFAPPDEMMQAVDNRRP
jgi:hypothetical protein